MPKCKNDPHTSYKGSEPSPKGKGFAAHATALGEVMRGTDGHNWQVQGVRGGSQRWVKLADDEVDPPKVRRRSPRKTSPKKAPARKTSTRGVAKRTRRTARK